MNVQRALGNLMIGRTTFVIAHGWPLFVVRTLFLYWRTAKFVSAEHTPN